MSEINDMLPNGSTETIYNTIYEQLKGVDTTDLSDEVDGNAYSNVTEEQKIYFWIRLYLKDDNINVEIGEDITIKYTPSGEELKTKFICYDKIGLSKDHDDQVTSYTPEDNRKVLCLMIDTKQVNNNDDVPFIRTLFKTGYHYEYQLMKRDELQFISRGGVILEYFDCDF
jgi:hypothetical protein